MKVFTQNITNYIDGIKVENDYYTGIDDINGQVLICMKPDENIFKPGGIKVWSCELPGGEMVASGVIPAPDEVTVFRQNSSHNMVPLMFLKLKLAKNIALPIASGENVLCELGKQVLYLPVSIQGYVDKKHVKNFELANAQLLINP